MSRATHNSNPNAHQQLWLDIIQAGALELRALLGHPDSLSATTLDQKLYAQVLLGTLQLDASKIRQARVTLFCEMGRPSEGTSEPSLIRSLIQVRSLFRRFRSFKNGRKISSESLKSLWTIVQRRREHLQKQGPAFEAQLFSAEILFIFADLYFRAQDYHASEALTEKAVLAYRSIGAKRKALRCELNLIVDRSHQDPTRNHLPELIPVFMEARKLRDVVTMSSALHSISHEYECLGAFRTSLKAINQAITLSLTGHLSTKIGEYFAHKTDLLVKMALKSEAQAAFEQLQTLPSEFSKSSEAYLQARHPWLAKKSSTAIPESAARPAAYWIDKEIVATKLASHEEALLSFIATKPRDKFELSQHLYGAEIPFESAEARLKNLLFRIRKKFPELIIFKNDKYSLGTDAKAMGQ